MRTVIYAMNASLDGYIESASGDLDWSNPDEDLHRHFEALDAGIEVHCYGRKLYQIMADFWPSAEEQPGISDYERDYARTWVAMRKVVFSRTLSQVAWNSELVSSGFEERARSLKTEGDGLMSVAGAELAASFMRYGLIDEYRVYVHPIVLGGGKRMFPDLAQRIPLRLKETQSFANGVQMLRYAKA